MFYIRKLHYQSQFGRAHIQKNAGWLTEGAGTSVGVGKVTWKSNRKLVSFQSLQRLHNRTRRLNKYTDTVITNYIKNLYSPNTPKPSLNTFITFPISLKRAAITAMELQVCLGFLSEGSAWHCRRADHSSRALSKGLHSSEKGKKILSINLSQRRS